METLPRFERSNCIFCPLNEHEIADALTEADYYPKVGLRSYGRHFPDGQSVAEDGPESRTAKPLPTRSRSLIPAQRLGRSSKYPGNVFFRVLS
jgi:hypothetical protein